MKNHKQYKQVRTCESCGERYTILNATSALCRKCRSQKMTMYMQSQAEYMLEQIEKDNYTSIFIPEMGEDPDLACSVRIKDDYSYDGNYWNHDITRRIGMAFNILAAPERLLFFDLRAE